jgi:Transposase DDE domain
MSIEAILQPILAKLSGIGKHQRTFFIELVTVFLGRQGRATFENLGRYSRFTELTFRRQFATFFDWVGFNMACIDWQKETYIGIVDCSFLPKSGKATFGLDKFWSSCADKALSGLEVSVLACVGVVSKQTWALDATQTPAKLETDATKNYTRLSFYLEQLADCLPRLRQLVYWVADGYYAKVQVIDLFIKHKRHLITRLRTDADLYYRWTKGRQPGQKGRTRLYDGKVAFDDLSRWESVGQHPVHESVGLYSQVLYSKRFKRNLRVVLLLQDKSQKYVLLASTDVEQDPTQIALYYHLRFGIELLFRDAKQFTGLSHCQSRSDVKIDYHLNASLSTVNVARLLLAADESLHHSMNALVRRLTSRRVWQLIYKQLSLEGLVDVNQFDSVKCQFWGRRAT